MDFFKAKELVTFFRTANLKDIALKLVKDGPVKQERTSRRVRALFNKAYVFDVSNAAQHVWEHPFYPQYYIPTSSIKGKLQPGEAIDGESSAFLCTFTSGEKSTDRVVRFDKGKLAGLVRFEFSALDQWFEEDVPIYVHPKDPYKRVDILPSSRHVSVKVAGTIVAESSNNLFLYETGLKPRYYMPLTAAKWEFLTPSETTTSCPYKGTANYYNVVVDGKKHEDLVWWYKLPTQESASIAGHICFYNEKVEIRIDGEIES